MTSSDKENYRIAYTSFQEATRIIKEVTSKLDHADVDEAGRNFPLVSWCIEKTMQLLDKHLPEILVSPETLDIADKIRFEDSIDFFKTMATRLKQYWNTLYSILKKKGKSFPPELSALEPQLRVNLDKIEEKINQIEVPLKHEEASNELGEYYRSISDIDSTSKNFGRLTYLISKNQKLLENQHEEKESKSSDFSQLLDNFIKIKDLIKEKIDQISNRMTGLVAGFCSVLKDTLTKFEDSFRGEKRIY